MISRRRHYCGPKLRTGASGRSAFTLVEVLAAMVLIAMVIPLAMRGIVAASQAADGARRRNEAAGLAQAQLMQIVATGQWQNGNLSGDFGSDWPGYSWQATANNWALDTTNLEIKEIDLKVNWGTGTQAGSVSTSTLAYLRGQ